MKLIIKVLTIFTALFFSEITLAEDGITSDSITFGMTNALTGPAEALGKGVRKGVQIYFDKVNQEGGIHGRQLKFISYDDGYEPRQTVKMTKKLIMKDKVFALFQYVGTPTSKAAVPLAKKHQIPYVAPFTGAEFLRNPNNHHVFNVRASYFDETEALVNFFVQKGAKKIAIFIQDDGYGNAGKAGVVKALKKRKMKLAAEGRYKRNTTRVKSGLKKIAKAKPDAVIMVGAYTATGKAVREMKKNPQLKTALIANISFVGTSKLIQEMGPMGEGSYISQVMPSPTISNLEIVKQYREDMKKAGEKPTYTSLEGYINAAILAEVLKKTGKDINRKSFMKSFETYRSDLGGLKIHNSSSLHQSLSEVYLTRVKDGKAVPENWDHSVGH